MCGDRVALRAPVACPFPRAVGALDGPAALIHPVQAYSGPWPKRRVALIVGIRAYFRLIFGSAETMETMETMETIRSS